MHVLTRQRRERGRGFDVRSCILAAVTRVDDGVGIRDNSSVIARRIDNVPRHDALATGHDHSAGEDRDQPSPHLIRSFHSSGKSREVRNSRSRHRHANRARLCGACAGGVRDRGRGFVLVGCDHGRHVVARRGDDGHVGARHLHIHLLPGAGVPPSSTLTITDLTDASTTTTIPIAKVGPTVAFGAETARPIPSDVQVYVDDITCQITDVVVTH